MRFRAQPSRRMFAPLFIGLCLTALAVVPARTQPGPAMSLKVGWFPVPQVEPLFVAVEKGFFEKEGLRLEPVQLQAGPQSIEAALAGAIDGGLGGVVPGAFALLRKVPIKMVITIGTTKPGTRGAAIVTPTQSTIKGIADLKGKTIALYCRNCITHALLIKALTTVGLSGDDVRIVTLPGPNILPALLNGQVDAAYLYEPLVAPALEKGTRAIIYEDAIFPDMETGGWFFTEKTIETKKKEIQAFVNGMRQAMAFIQSHAAEAKLILAKYLKLDPAVAPKMGGVYYDPSGRINTDNMNDVVAMMVSLKMLPQTVKMEDIVTTEFLNAK